MEVHFGPPPFPDVEVPEFFAAAHLEDPGGGSLGAATEREMLGLPGLGLPSFPPGPADLDLGGFLT